MTTTKNKKISAVTLKKKKSVLLDARASMPKRKKLKNIVRKSVGFQQIRRLQP